MLTTASNNGKADESGKTVEAYQTGSRAQLVGGDSEGFHA
jgi:hypothetical protein